MPKKNPNQMLTELETWKRRYGEGDAKLRQLLSSLSRATFDDAESLVRLHETVLFLRAYPHNPRVLKLVEQILNTFPQRISRLRAADADLTPLDDPEVAGIAGMSVTSNFSYALVRWLVEKYPARLSIDWEWMENEDQFGVVLPKLMPLLDDDAMVEAHVPFHMWVRAASGGKSELVWLVKRFAALEISEAAKAHLYDSLKLHVRWEFSAAASRTAMKLPAKRVFFHEQALIKRREISLVNELTAPPIQIEQLSVASGEKILGMARETSAVRYRELHGFTFGDPARLIRANLGRGTEAFVITVPPEYRLPLRAYHAALIFKNGVPVGYFEGLSIAERMESGFNLYYTFRDGETAWLYARILRLMRQLLGVEVFSLDPYQIGHENEEGIESGAFWFYRKLGFRPVRPELQKLAAREEQKMAKDARHRTSLATLRRLATGHMIFELRETGEWDRFEARNIGLAAQRRMAREFAGDSQTLRQNSVSFVNRALGLKKQETSSRLFADLSIVLAEDQNLANWSREEKRLAAEILRAKTHGQEADYLKKTQKHASLRALLIKLGCGQRR
jgi:hypothetical protein